MAHHLEALRRVEGDAVTFAAPSPGRFTASVEAGRLVEPGQVLGQLQVLERRYLVTAPEGPALRVARLASRSAAAPVGWGDALVIATAAELDGEVSLSADTLELGELPPGAQVFRAPMAGQFYRRPTPEDPAFCEVGAVVTSGTRIGLVEVMKFFYPLLFDGAGQWRVERFLAEDGRPLEAGAPVMVIVPA